MLPNSKYTGLIALFIFSLNAIAKLSYLNLNSGYGLLRTNIAAEALDLPIGTCNAATPCPNGACCAGVSVPVSLNYVQSSFRQRSNHVTERLRSMWLFAIRVWCW